MANKTPMIGALIGAGASTVGSVTVRQAFKNKPTLTRWSEAIGLGLGALPGMAMLFVKKGKYRDAGYTCLAAAVMSSGVRQIEELMFGQRVALDAATQKLIAAGAAAEAAAASESSETSGIGLVSIERARALRGARTEPTTVLRGPTIDPTTVLSGASMPQLVGANLAAASRHVQLVGAPALAEHSGAWGATLFSR